MSLAVLLTTVVHALVYAGILLIILFRCIGVAQHPRFCFWFTAVSKFVLECLMGGIESMPAYVSSQQLPVLDSLLQAMSTLIFLVIVGVFGRGYLPRNFIKVTCYLYQINLVLIPFTYLAYRLTLPYPEDSWQYLLASICINLIAFAEVLAVSRLVNGWLDRLLQRISDRLCLIFFVLACLVYLGKELLMLRESGYVIIGSSAGILGGYFLGSILLLSLVLIVVLLFYGMKDYHRFHRIHRLENRMMLDYHTNVSGLYLGVRQLRHDLSNHLAADWGRSAARESWLHERTWTGPLENDETAAFAPQSHVWRDPHPGSSPRRYGNVEKVRRRLCTGDQAGVDSRIAWSGRAWRMACCEGETQVAACLQGLAWRMARLGEAPGTRHPIGKCRISAEFG